jgi:glycosyltransferase involved in cell wall biosynthesis
MIRPLRIAHAAPPLERVPPRGYGGTERVVHQLVSELVARGHEVTTFASGDSDVPGRLVPTIEEALRPAGFGGDASPWYLSTILSVLESAREFDVIHSHLEWYSTILSKVSPVPVVTTFHGRLDFPWARDLLIRGEGNYVAISRAHAATHPDVPWAGIVHNGLDLANAPFERQRGDALCFVGRVAPEKGIIDAIDIAKRVGRRLRIAAKIGTTPHESAYYTDVFLPALAAAGDDVEFLGEISGADRDRLFAESFATLMPGSWPEPFGLVAIESLACGTPLIARPAGALPEIVRHGQDGFFGDDVAEMAFYVDRVADLDRAAIRASVIDRFSAARMADDYEAIYERLIADAPGAEPVGAPGSRVARSALTARLGRGAPRFENPAGVERSWSPRRTVSRARRADSAANPDATNGARPTD